MTFSIDDSDHTQSLIQSYLDGELSGADLEEFERKLAESSELDEAVAQAEREHDDLRSLLTAPPASDMLRKRIERGLDDMDRARALDKRRELRAWLFPGTATIAAAAALLCFVVLTPQSADNENDDDGRGNVARDAVQARFRQQPVDLVSARPVQPTATTRGPSVKPGLARTVAFTGQPTGMGRSTVSEQVADYFQAAVTVPRWRDGNVMIRGWRPTQLSGMAAAELQYLARLDGESHPLTLHMVAARNLNLKGRSTVRVGSTQVWVDRAYGYSVVLFRSKQGIGYVFSSELDSQRLVSLVAGSSLFLAR